ncbi:MAG: response regulator [Acidobacteria bacterium]|nr:response regulator [Acidobacteriota bacterium]
MDYKILLADGSVTVQKIITLTFSDEGVEVFTVNSGDEAISRLQQMRPALIMADVSIPGKDGYQICEFVKNHPEMKKTPVILLVPPFESFDADRARKIGADHHITKPFQHIPTLISTVMGMIEPGKKAAHAGAHESQREITSNETSRRDQERGEIVVMSSWTRGGRSNYSGREDLDSILELDEVLFDVWRKGPDTSGSDPDPATENADGAGTSKNTSISLSQEAIDEIVDRLVARLTDEIVDRVVARLTSELSEKLTRELVPPMVEGFAETIKQQQAADKKSYREADSLLELDEF